MLSWQAYQELTADMRGSAEWGETVPAVQGKVEAAAGFGFRQPVGPEWTNEVPDDGSPWKGV